MSATENTNAEHALNDKLLSIKHRLGEVCTQVCGPVPPRPESALTTPASINGKPSADFLSQLFAVQSANHDIADQLMNAVIHLENSFGIGSKGGAEPEYALTPTSTRR